MRRRPYRCRLPPPSHLRPPIIQAEAGLAVTSPVISAHYSRSSIRICLGSTRTPESAGKGWIKIPRILGFNVRTIFGYFVRMLTQPSKIASRSPDGLPNLQMADNLSGFHTKTSHFFSAHYNCSKKSPRCFNTPFPPRINFPDHRLRLNGTYRYILMP